MANTICFERWFSVSTDEIDWDYVWSVPEFKKLNECKQTPKWHMEGNAATHTKLVVEEMYKLCDDFNIEGIRRKILIMAALFHDIGKGVTTEFLKGDWHSYGHEIAGEKITRRLLWDEYMPYREQICSLVRFHMERCGFMRIPDVFTKIHKMAYDVDCQDLFYVMMADIRGSKPFDPSTDARDVGIATTIKHHGHLLSNVDGVDEYALKEHIFGRYPLWQEKPDLPVIYVMIGLPGSGKDTWIKQNIQGNPVILCRDDIRAELGFCKQGEKIVGTRQQEDKVSEVFNKRLEKASEEGKTIVINNINLKKKYRDAYKKFVKKKYMWIYEYIEAPLLKDNYKRREGEIPENVFDQMILNFDYPRNEEYNLMFIEKQK